MPVVQHQLPAVRVAGQRQGQVRLDRRVEGVRVMRQQYGKGVRLALPQNFAHLEGSHLAAPRSLPAIQRKPKN